VRAGATPSASSDDRAWVVPESLRGRLGRVYGPVLKGEAAGEKMRTLSAYATCGDYVTAQAIQSGNLPLIGIVDGKTERSKPFALEQFHVLADRRFVKVRNPMGMLTDRLRKAVQVFVASGGGLIEVEGEEDLASLALVESMPAGATVIYGIPGEGASFVTVDAAAKDQVTALIAQMEERHIDLGR
jgi:GTP-dependent dephospho-CoA kinase